MKHTVRTAVISSAVTLFVCLLLFGGLLLSFFGVIPLKLTDNYYTIQAIIRSCIDKDAIYDFDESDAEEAMLYAYVVGGLGDDDYAAYYTPEQYAQLLSSQEGQFSGFGVQISSTVDDGEGLFVFRVIGGSPSQEAGICVGDRIVAVNGQDLTGMTYTDAFALVTACKTEETLFTVRRGEETLEISVTPTSFVEQDVTWSVSDNIGIIRIHNFTSVSATQFREALQSVLDLKVEGIVFDVRNNLGGQLVAVESILETLVPKGELIVTTEYKDTEEHYYSREEAWTDVPMAVLINGSSASASELFASELRDVVGATLVGERSYGKGVGQTTRTLPSGAGLKFTTFRYYTKNHNEYDGIGLIPDVEVALPEEKELYQYALSPEEDDQLAAALNIISDMTKGK